MKSFLLAALALVLASPVSAAPTLAVGGGATSVALAESFVAALVERGVTPAPVKPAKLRRGVASFPIPAGVVDPESGLDLFHVGGLTLSAGGTTVALLNFLIDTNGPPQLTGVVSVDGDVLGRIKIADLDLSEAVDLSRGKRITIANIGVNLSAEAAAALNLVFGLPLELEIPAGLEIGDALVATRVRGRAILDDEDSDSDSDSDSD